jgi:hypothetical protein
MMMSSNFKRFMARRVKPGGDAGRDVSIAPI